MLDIAWHTNLPAGWSIARVGDHVSILNGYPFDAELFSLTSGMPLVRIRDIYNDTAEVRFSGEPVPEAIIRRGDVLVGMDGDFNVARWRGEDALLNQRVCCLRPMETMDAGFLHYLLPIPLKIVNDLTYATTVKHLSSLDIGKLRIPYPPIDTQRAISAYLNKEVISLDSLILEKQQLLVLLAEKRRATIADFVAHGLSADAPRRESGIPWLGEIPAHWQIERAKWLFTERDDRSDVGDEELLSVSHLTGVTSRAEKDVNMFMAESLEGYKRCRAGDLVINTLWAWMGAMGVARQPGIVSPAYNVYQPGAQLDPEYVDLLVRIPRFVEEITRYSKGVWSSRLRLYPEGLYEAWLPVPPLDEQQEIVKQVQIETKKLDALAEATERTIGLLQERRSALISAAVTGQVTMEECHAGR